MANLKKLALVVGGGPAPGINGVISAVTLEAINNGVTVFGIQDGYKWLVRGRTDRVRMLTRDEVKSIFTKGGSILGTARTNPTKKPEEMQRVLGFLQDQGFDALVSIGGDDTAYTASRVYEEAGGRIKVVHVPKTIDNDLPLGPSQPTFGFETARHVGVQVVRNLAEDARTTSRWYLVVSMGRAAGHLALGIGKASSATLTIIPEEFEGHISLDHLCDIIIGSIVKRAARDTHYGVVVLAEGLIESVGAENLRGLMTSGNKYYGELAEDPHGNLRLGQIDFGRMIKDHLTVRLAELGMDVAFIDKDLGYELRCADPIPFDVEYTRDLGYGAVKFLRSPDADKFGAVVSLVDGKLVPKPFDTMIDPKTKRMATRRVNIGGEGFECALQYMIRLEKGDLENPEALAKLAKHVKMKPEAFKDRFGKVVWA